MDINISGKQVDLGESFQQHVEQKVRETVSKYLDRVTQVDVVVSRESHMFRVDIHGNTGTHSHIMLKSHDESEEIYSAFELAMEKIEKQLRRYKRRITNHHRRYQEQQETLQSLQAKSYVLQPESDSEELEEEGAPVVIAESPADIATLTVSEAVMKMDLEHLPAVMFYNSAHGRINIIYRRSDGNISWVDPEPAQEKAA